MNKFRNLEMQVKTRSLKKEYKYFVGTTLKDPFSYKIGEKIIFKIRVKYMDDYLDIPYVKCTLFSDDGQNGESYIEKSEDGWFYIEASISKSGFVYINALACDEDKNVIEGIAPYNGSAGVNPGELFGSTETPSEYMEFWDSLKKQVEETEPEILFKESVEDESHPDFEIYDIRLKAPGSDYASAMVAYPKNALPGTLKLAMFFQGYGVGPINARPLDGYLTVNVMAHALPCRGDNEFFADMRDNKLKGYGFSEEENKKPETTYWAKMFLRNLQVLRFFKDNELLNKKDYHFIGSSQGGMQALNMAAHFEKASYVILNVPWMAEVHGDVIAGKRKQGMPKGEGIKYFDITVGARFLKCPAYIISGMGDATCNSGTQMALFNEIKSPKYIRFYQNKVHSFTIPWDNIKYEFGDLSLSDKYIEHISQYYDWN